MAGPASPDIRNYYIGKGRVSFKPDGAPNFIDMGNCPSYEVTPDITKLDHFSSRSGVKKKDRSVATEVAATVALTLDEYTLENLRLALLGSAVTTVAGKTRIELLDVAEIKGQMKFEGANDVGSRFTLTLNQVSFNAGAGVQFISDEWGELELTADVQADNTGAFGTLELDKVEGESDSESDSASASA